MCHNSNKRHDSKNIKKQKTLRREMALSHTRINLSSFINLRLHSFLFLFFFFSLPHHPLNAKKIPYWGEREDGFRCYSCVTGSSDWSTERCNPRINMDVFKGCGNGTTGCFKWIVNPEMTIRGCGVNYLAEEEEEDEEDIKTWDFDKGEYPHLADMCRNLTHDMNSGKRLRKRTPQNILTILAHSNINKFEHEKYLNIFNQTCTKILTRSKKFESGLLARRRPPTAGNLRNVKFCKWYDACNGAVDPALRISLILFHLLFCLRIVFRR